MRINHQLREGQLKQATAAYLSLMKQIDNLLTLVRFYLERYPGSLLRTKELARASVILGNLGASLAVTLTNLKFGGSRAQTAMEVELVTLNEIWANVQAIVYIFKSCEMDLEPFEHDTAAVSFGTLVSINRLLT